MISLPSLIKQCILFFVCLACSQVQFLEVQTDKVIEPIVLSSDEFLSYERDIKKNNQNNVKKNLWGNFKNTKKVSSYCKKITKNFLHWGWGLSGCQKFKWLHVRDSVLGDPLMWVQFGDEKLAKQKSYDRILVLCGVHGDEITPVKFCFDLIHYVHDKFNQETKKLILVSPIVSPDSYFKPKPTRTNARGVDVNRNFPTKDWQEKAHKLWRGKYKSDKRKFPGKYALSEPEVLFQVNLLKRYKPTMIITVHAPLTILDYDGPGHEHDHSDLIIQMSKNARGYKIKNYPFFPGSLGNYAGNERSIPTYTLELPSSDNRKTKEYWSLFEKAMESALFGDFNVVPDRTTQ